MTRTKSKSKTSKTNRKADESASKPQAKKKAKMSPKKQSAKAKDEPADEPAGQTETASAESLATAVTEPRTTATETPVAAVDEGTGENASASTATPTAAALSDSRMPAIGTVLQKRDRQGTLRCECEIVEGGVRYGGTVYRSLSSAAVAAAKDLGLAAKAMNGFTFWGVTKLARPATDPLGGLERAWNKYQARLEGVLERAKAGEHKEPALATLERHTRVLQNLKDEVA